ncbi:MAG: TonB-dependent receptor [Parvibaculaceae bacterium]
MRSLRSLSCGTAMCLVFGQIGFGVAAAQDQVDQETAIAVDKDEASPARMGTITVTAQKREQSLQDVAGSVSAIGGDAIEKLGLTSVQELSMQVPGLDFGQTNGSTFITLRGVTLNVDTGVAEPNIAIHQDGLFMPRSTMALLDYTDVQRVEVVRGPQGTLYGRNATGGAINFISKKPESAPAAEVKVGYGNFDTLNVRGIATGALTQNVNGRLSVAYDRRGEGYVDNTFTGSSFDENEMINVRGALAFDFSEDLKVDASVQYQDETFQTYQQMMEPLTPLATVFFPQLATAEAPSAPWTIGNEYNPDSSRTTLIGRVSLTYELTPDITFKSLTGYIDQEFENRLDGDGTSGAILTIEDRTQPSESYSQEFNLAGVFGESGSWLLGAYLYSEDFSSDIPVMLPSGFALASLPPGTTFASQIREETESVAVFADATYPLTEDLRVFGGVRVSKDEKDFTQTAGAIIPGVPESLTLSCEGTQSSKSYDSTSPRIGLQYDFSDDVMGYIQYSEGYKSGGLNSSTCDNFYRPESLKAIEAGVKSTLAEGRIVLNASVYSYDYKDFQVFKYLTTSAVIENADAENYGAELEGKFYLSDNWMLDAALTYLSAEFTNYSSFDQAQPAAGEIDLSGYTLPRAPEFSANLGLQANYPVNVGSFDQFFLRLDAKISDSFVLRPFALPEDEQDAYIMANMNAVLSSDSTGFSVRAFARNIGDEDVISHKFYTGTTDAYYGNYLPPRTFGIELSKTF